MKMHSRMTENPKRGVTSRDCSLGKVQMKSSKRTGEVFSLPYQKNNCNKHKMLVFIRDQNSKTEIN